MVTSALATVCGIEVDYEFLLGSLRHHSEVATFHVVLDVSPAAKRRRFHNLPFNTVWVYDDSYGSGDWKTFACRTARLRSLDIARSLGVDVIMHLDADEFVSKEAGALFEAAQDTCVESRIVHWGCDGLAFTDRNGWCRRIWSARLNVTISQNVAWMKTPQYNGNPERHPIPTWPPDAKVVRLPTLAHHHLHWAFKEKGQASFGNWPRAPFAQDGVGVWPEPLVRWRGGGPPPSSDFE